MVSKLNLQSIKQHLQNLATSQTFKTTKRKFYVLEIQSRDSSVSSPPYQGTANLATLPPDGVLRWQTKPPMSLERALRV